MPGLPARFAVVSNVPGDVLAIKDIGPWNKHLTVTNDAEYVVKSLVRQGLLSGGRRLFYYDTDNNLDEILVRNGRFAGFAPGPKGGK